MSAIDLGPRGQPALVDRELVGVGDDHRPFDHVLQLANVPGPRVGLEAIERPLADPTKGPSGLPRVAPDEVLHQDRNVFPPLS